MFLKSCIENFDREKDILNKIVVTKKPLEKTNQTQKLCNFPWNSLSLQSSCCWRCHRRARFRLKQRLCRHSLACRHPDTAPPNATISSVATSLLGRLKAPPWFPSKMFKHQTPDDYNSNMNLPASLAKTSDRLSLGVLVWWKCMSWQRSVGAAKIPTQVGEGRVGLREDPTPWRTLVATAAEGAAAGQVQVGAFTN